MMIPFSGSHSNTAANIKDIPNEVLTTVHMTFHRSDASFFSSFSGEPPRPPSGPPQTLSGGLSSTEGGVQKPLWTLQLPSQVLEAPKPFTRLVWTGPPGSKLEGLQARLNISISARSLEPDPAQSGHLPVLDRCHKQIRRREHDQSLREP